MRHFVPVLAAAFALSTATAQTAIAHANFDTLIYDNGSSMGGPNLWVGIRTQIPAATVATRVEVWTGEGAGTNSISLWTHDPVNNRPLAMLGTGSWAMGRTNGWQGAYLSPPVPLTANQDVWVVWAPINGSQSSVESTGAGAQPYRPSFDNGATWGGPYQGLQWKFRIWTGTPGHYTVYGTGCTGSRGRPDLAWFGMPMAGSTFQVTLDRGPLGSFAFLSFGDSDTQSNGTPLPYSLAGLGAPNCAVLASPLVTMLYGTDPVTGQSSATVTLPADPSLVGFPIYDQWFCYDPAANALGISVSNAGAGTIGA